jgi:hypothetical protein
MVGVRCRRVEDGNWHGEIDYGGADHHELTGNRENNMCRRNGSFTGAICTYKQSVKRGLEFDVVPTETRASKGENPITKCLRMFRSGSTIASRLRGCATGVASILHTRRGSGKWACAENE